jgi:hypothetical protein
MNLIKKHVTDLTYASSIGAGTFEFLGGDTFTRGNRAPADRFLAVGCNNARRYTVFGKIILNVVPIPFLLVTLISALLSWQYFFTRARPNPFPSNVRV